MKAKLIVSVDCEGKWGIADRGKKRLDVITSRNLLKSYNDILNILRKYNMRASFGFVAALCMDEEWLKEKCHQLERSISYNGNDWLTEVKASLKNKDLSGWCEPNLIKMVLDDGNQHVCSHGGFHLPYDEKKVSRNNINEDIKAIENFKSKYNINIDIMIFPRNIIGYQYILKNYNFKAYRDIDTCENIGGYKGKAIRFFNEMVSLDRFAKKKTAFDCKKKLICLSCAKFLNAKIGIRKYISVNITKCRIKNLVDSAVKSRSTIHFYTHPHNFINDHAMNDKFEYLLGIASEYRKCGKLEVQTMKDELDEYNKYQI